MIINFFEKKIRLNFKRTQFTSEPERNVIVFIIKVGIELSFIESLNVNIIINSLNNVKTRNVFYLLIIIT